MPKREIDSPLYSITDGARYLHTDTNLVRKAIKLGYLPVFDFGSQKLYRPIMDKFILKYMGAGKGEKLQKLVEQGEKAKSSQQELDDDERQILI